MANTGRKATPNTYVFKFENGADVLYSKDKASLAEYVVDNIVINEKDGNWETLDINKVLDDIEEIARQEWGWEAIGYEMAEKENKIITTNFYHSNFITILERIW